jgi:hypothetical protein
MNRRKVASKLAPLGHSDTVLRRHAARYRTARGHDPFDEALVWAQALVRWHRRHPDHEKRRLVDALTRAILQEATGDPDPPDLGVTDNSTQPPELVSPYLMAVAEALRLTMARDGRPIGDMSVWALQHELGVWLARRSLPGDPTWPPPDSPHAERWHAWAHVVRADDIRWASIRHAMQLTLDAVMAYAATTPHLAACSRWELGERRYALGRSDYRALAEIAPALEITPVPVADPAWHRGFPIDTIQHSL